MFVRMLVVASGKTRLDLRKIIFYPITAFPLSLAHCDGAHMKTDKSALLRKLESFQTETITEDELPISYAQIYDGGLLLHSILSLTAMGASYASIARTMLSMVCSGRAQEVHVCFDKYVQNSIKDSERKQGGAVDTAYTITGPDQKIRQSGKTLLTNGTFKNELSKFLLKEWRKSNYWEFLRGKRLFASYGGECLQYIPDGHQNITISTPSYLQGDHEEADTLIAFHAANLSEDDIVVRASDTDILVILIGAIGRQIQGEISLPDIIMDCGMGNNRRYINVTNIAEVLEKRTPGLACALPGFHAFTGCDFTSAFYRKGKNKLLSIIEKDQTGCYVNLFTDMGDLDNDVDQHVVSEFVCRIYAVTNTRDINEAKHQKLIKMTGKVDLNNPLANIKRIDCSLLPPSLPVLLMKIRRTQYVTAMWTRAVTEAPANGLSPTDYGWYMDNSLLKPTWFEGPATPDRLFAEDSTNRQNVESEDNSDALSESDDELESLLDIDVWSEDSDSEEGEDDD